MYILQFLFYDAIVQERITAYKSAYVLDFKFQFNLYSTIETFSIFLLHSI